MPQFFTTSQWVPYPVELVFAFFANPGNLPHLCPKWQQARLESSRLVPPPARPLAADPALRYQSPAAGAGSELEISMRPFRGVPARAHWLVRISDFAWNSHFRDEQVTGPFALWRHTHNIRSETQDGVSGTRVTDDLEYDLPLGPLGSVANSIFVRRQIRATFRFRHERLQEILPVAARQAARRS